MKKKSLFIIVGITGVILVSILLFVTPGLHAVFDQDTARTKEVPPLTETAEETVNGYPDFCTGDPNIVILDENRPGGIEFLDMVATHTIKPNEHSQQPGSASIDVWMVDVEDYSGYGENLSVGEQMLYRKYRFTLIYVGDLDDGIEYDYPNPTGFACVLVEENTTDLPVISIENGVFLFDALNAMDLLSQEGDYDILDMRAAPVLSGPAVKYSQDDYFKIAEATQTALYQSLADWGISEMHFSVPRCEDAPMGPQQARLVFFKPSPSNVGNALLWRTFQINPNYNTIAYEYSTEYPLPEQLPPNIDFEGIMVPAEEALRIAEANGGANFRTAAENHCDINLDYLISGSGTTNSWTIEYLSDTGELKMIIDAETGEIIE